MRRFYNNISTRVPEMNFTDTLYSELDQWNFNGDEATFWWRDDDAQKSTPELETILALSTKYDVPVALAVIPDGSEPSLVKLVRGNPLVNVLQHGFSHSNHAPADQKKQELGNHREAEVIQQQLHEGLLLLSRQFGDQAIPVMVPPWNRISAEVTSLLAELDILGLSCYGQRQVSEVAENLWLVNSHADIINWKQNKSFIGEQQAITILVDHLQSKREGRADQAEPTGLLTHHLVHDNASNDFLEALFMALDEHPAVTWLSAERVFQTRWRDNKIDSNDEAPGLSTYQMPGLDPQ